MKARLTFERLLQAIERPIERGGHPAELVFRAGDVNPQAEIGLGHRLRGLSDPFDWRKRPPDEEPAASQCQGQRDSGRRDEAENDAP